MHKYKLLIVKITDEISFNLFLQKQDYLKQSGITTLSTPLKVSKQ